MHDFASWIPGLLHASLLTIEPAVAHYGYAAIFLMVALEALGAPVPGESGLIGAALLAARGDLSIEGVLACVWAGAVVGDCIGYLIGRLAGRALVLRYGSRIGLTAKRLTALEAMFHRRGAAIVVGARFVVVLRQLNGIVAGTLKMPWLKFLLANILGGLLWTLAWGLGVYLVAGSLGIVVHRVALAVGAIASWAAPVGIARTWAPLLRLDVGF
jgi:membrane protein DedA with SNARE-associated domain